MRAQKKHQASPSRQLLHFCSLDVCEINCSACNTHSSHFCTRYLRWLPFPFCFSCILSELSLHQGQEASIFSKHTRLLKQRHCRKSSLAATNCVVYKQYSFPKIVQRRHLPITTNSWDFALFSCFTSTAQHSEAGSCSGGRIISVSDWILFSQCVVEVVRCAAMNVNTNTFVSLSRSIEPFSAKFCWGLFVPWWGYIWWVSVTYRSNIWKIILMCCDALFCERKQF